MHRDFFHPRLLNTSLIKITSSVFGAERKVESIAKFAPKFFPEYRINKQYNTNTAIRKSKMTQIRDFKYQLKRSSHKLGIEVTQKQI
jgi:hypothetical protein